MTEIELFKMGPAFIESPCITLFKCKVTKIHYLERSTPTNVLVLAKFVSQKCGVPGL